MDSDENMEDMGADATFNEANEQPSSGKATLKRGDACLACRRRRIRCDAAKPACATCVRLKKQCIYETGKSTSRIAQLKARIAELEAQLQNRSPEQRLSGGDANGLGLVNPSAPNGAPTSSSGSHANSHFPASVHSSPPHTQQNVSPTHGHDHQQLNGMAANGQTISPSQLVFSIPTVTGQTLQIPAEAMSRPTTAGTQYDPQQQQQHVAPQVSPQLPQQQQQQPQQHVPQQQYQQRQQPPAPTPSGGGPEDTLGAVLGALPSGRIGRQPYPQSTGPRPLGQPDPNFDFDLSFLDQPMNDLSTSLFNATVIESEQIDMAAVMRRYHGISARSDVTGVPMRVPGTPSTVNGTSATSTAASPLGQGKPGEAPAVINKMMAATKRTHRRHMGFPDDDDDDDDMGMGGYVSALGDMEILPSLPQGRELVGGWFDPNDVPPAVRDHLLDLFFSKTNAGNLFHVVFHLPRLYTRLTMPPNKRPHPCLMYAMYCSAARLSSQPAIQQLEAQFCHIAEKQIRTAIKNHDRLLDVVRAMALLVSYLFAKEQYSLGYHMTGTAVRLAIACGLDRIPTSVWAPQPPFNAAIHCTLRMGGYSLPPPEDPIDLAERIYAFWAVYETDLCTAVAYLWHTGLPIEDIRTPLPRPMVEYELGLVSAKDDVPIFTLFDAMPPPFDSDTSFFVLRLKAISCLARVLKLRQDRPEVDPPAQSPSAEPHGCSYPGSSYPAYETHPAGFARLKNALDRYVEQLPAERQPPWAWDSEDETDILLPRMSMPRDTSVLHFLIGNAYMQLWNVRALDAENKIAILVARRLVNVMYQFQTEPLSTGYDIFMITIWNEVAMVLLREAKRLQYIGEHERAKQVDTDLGVAIASMKKWGDVDLANEHDGSDIAAINGKMLDQLRAMSEQDWAEAVSESRRRYGGGAGGVGVLPCSKISGSLPGQLPTFPLSFGANPNPNS